MSNSSLSKTDLFLFNLYILIWIQALNILRKLSAKVISNLGMDALVAHPEALILSRLPLPPSGSRMTEMDVGSCLPRTQTVGGHWAPFQIHLGTYVEFKSSLNVHNG